MILTGILIALFIDPDLGTVIVIVGLFLAAWRKPKGKGDE